MLKERKVGNKDAFFNLDICFAEDLFYKTCSTILHSRKETLVRLFQTFSPELHAVSPRFFLALPHICTGSQRDTPRVNDYFYRQ